MRFDVESALVQYLRERGFDAYGDVPDDTTQPVPSSFLTVERTGGRVTEDMTIDQAAIVVQAWAPSRADALRLAIEADGVMLGFEAVPEVMRVYVNEMINFPPMNGDKRGRYQLAYTVATVTE
jgi:hypothetical protein